MKAVGVIRLQVGVWRSLAEVAEASYEMVVKDDQRIVRLRMSVVTLRHENDRREIHRPAPECGQELRLDADVANVLGIRVGFDRRNNFIERHCDRRRSGTYMNQPRFRQQIARRNVPELAFAAIRRQLHGLTVRAVKGFETFSTAWIVYSPAGTSFRLARG